MKKTPPIPCARHLAGLFFLGLIVFWSVGCNHCGNETKPNTGVAGDDGLDDIVSYIRAQYDLPAMATLLIHDGQLIEKSAVGKRSVDADTPVTSGDQWHIGSNTKSMTATLALLLVKEGLIGWDTTLGEMFPDLIGVMRPEYENVRLDMLLSHTSGLPIELPNYSTYYDDHRPLYVQRRAFVEDLLQLPSKSGPGQLDYSNAGYIVAGAMLEQATGLSWEALIQACLFQPLAMTTAGFGAPDTLGRLGQPLGHSESLFGKWVPVDPADGQTADNAPMLGPAGTVHAALDDMAAYLTLHLSYLRGQSVAGFPQAGDAEKLYEPYPGTHYALGWEVLSDKVILHNGSNTFWYSVMLVDGEKNTAFFAAVNAADLDTGANSRAISAVDDLLIELALRADAAFGSESL